MHRKYKLLIVGGFPPYGAPIYGGIVTSCQTLLSSSFSDHYELVLIDSTQISNPPPPLSVRSLLAFKRYIKFAQKLFVEKPDAVLLFTAVGFSVIEKGAMAWLARLTKVPVFLFPRGAGLIQIVQTHRLQRIVVRKLMRGATHILCQGPTWQRFSTNLLKFPKSHSPIVYNWTATSKMLKLGELRTCTRTNAIPKLLFLGWLEKEKGIFELLQACLTLSDKYQFRLIIAGRGNAEDQARLFVQGNNLQGVVEFVGWVECEKKEKLLANTDILVLPSWAEGFPNAIIEAMSAKLAIIVTTVGNVPDILVDGQQALLVPPKKTQALEVAIEQLVIDHQFRNELAERGHAFARDNFSVKQGVSKLTDLIDKAINETQIH